MQVVNYKQVLAIVIAIFSVLAVSSANLTDLFGANVAKTIGSASNLLNTILASVLAAYTSNSQQVKDASTLPGVEVQVSREATQQVASLAMDPDQSSIAPAPGEEKAVQRKAEGTAVV